MAATNEVLTSPRLIRLAKDLEGGRHAALETFWKERAGEGAPLVETIEGSDECLATFLWRDSGVSEPAAVVSNLTGGMGEPDPMIRLANSDVWHRSYRLPADTRETYQLSVNGRNITDPLNLRKHLFPVDEDTGYGGWESSVLELPAAPPQPWITPAPGVPAGRVEKHYLKSRILGNEYPIWIYMPPGHSLESEAQGFLLALDGWFYINLMPLPTILDNLLANGRLPRLAAVLVGSLAYSGARKRDYGCFPPYIDFLGQELLPWARERISLGDDPGQAAVAGASRGGLMAAYIGMRMPGVFGNVLSQSGSFAWKPEGDREPDWIARQLAGQPRLPVRFYLEAGRFETRVPTVEGTIDTLASNRRLHRVLQAKGYDVKYREYSGGHNPIIWRGTLADGLVELLGSSNNQKSKYPE